MTASKSPNSRLGSRAAATGVIFLSFIVAFEILIMISPFAFFFYAIFNPFLLALNQSSMTRWLTAFFLPHMIVPPDEVLKVIRILGSVFFVGGALLFLICAGQVYLGKLLKRGVATGGFYRFIRHPQYLGLGLTALGLVIMWPRFLNLALFALMLFLYYLLAKDEERRMTRRFGESYLVYMNRTGMFLPYFIAKVWTRKNAEPPQLLRPVRAAAIFVVLLPLVVGIGFVLRSYTILHLPLEEVSRVDVIAITKGDLLPARNLLPSVIKDPAVASKLQSVPRDKGHRVLAYFIPVDYVMQGMIADTGKEWKLFEQHKTLGMIAGYIFHPFAHLTEGHTGLMAAMHHEPVGHNNPAMSRRIIFMEISASRSALKSPDDDFGINIKRTPLFLVDVNLHTGEVLQVKETPTGSGWGTVPTPMF
jgi:protein-S-isoprenylcysteine O-methyltransferase Ste14